MIQIKHRHSGATLREVDAATLVGADLRVANLSGADLSGVNLRDANLSGANLSGANLSGATLRGADLSYANLSGATLRGANLHGADLHGADLSGANLRDASLSGANLSGANLRDADLRDANLHGANLHGANLSGAGLHGAQNLDPLAAARLSICPDGDLIGWKKLRDGEVVRLRIPTGARRSNATGRKCRAEFAQVLEMFAPINDGGAPLPPGHVGRSGWWTNKHTTYNGDPGPDYVVDGWVYPDRFEEDRWQECAPGIHFFLTRAEAEAWDL